MPTSAPIAKVTRPIPAGYFPRRRLYRLLDKARKAPVLWLTGPPGCGKTALVTTYIESRRLPCLWYKVDEGDADLATFFYYLGLAAAKAAPRRRKRLPLLTPERMPGLSVFAQRYFEDLSTWLPVPSLLVFDDCHRMGDDSRFFETIREGISRLTAGIGAVLISRADPHPSFARDRAHQLMEVVGWRDLRLTPEEVAGIARFQRKGRTPPGLAKELFERTDGWAAGLVLLLRGTDEESIEHRSTRRQVSAEIFDYFGNEIFQRLDEERKAFLLRSAFLPEMTTTMAERLTGDGQASQVLSYMNRHNYFTEKRLLREPVYVYHDLFRKFLLEQAAAMLSGEKFAEIRKAAAVLLEENGYIEHAAGLLRQARDWEALAKLILSQARPLVTQGRNRTLLEWLGALPNEVFHNDPWLLYWNGVALISFSPAESQVRFEEAFHKFEARGNSPGVFLSWNGVVLSILTAMGSYASLDAWIRLLPSLLERHRGFPSEEIGDEVTCSVFNALAMHRTPGIDIEPWADRSLAIARNTPNSLLKFRSGRPLYLYKLGKGGFQVAEGILASLRELLKRPDATPWDRLWTDWTEAALSLFLARYERCLRVVSDALGFAENSGVHVADRMILAQGALAALHLGDIGTMNRYRGVMAAALGNTRPVLTGAYHFVFACEALHRREFAKAVFHSEECVNQYEEAQITVFVPIMHLVAAHVHHARQESDEAAGHLAQARRVGLEMESPHALWLSNLTEAFFHLDGQRDAPAVAVLRDGLEVGREQGLFGTFIFVPGFLEKVVSKALEEGIEADYVRELIRRNRLLPDPGTPGLEQWPWPVKVYTMGRFKLLVDGHPVEFGRKVQQRPLSLLKALVSLGGQSVPEARLAELLWPEADGDLAHQSFTAALSRLRKLLGIDEALTLKEGLLSLSSRHCWVDAWAFAQFLGQANHATKEGKAEESVRLLEKAVSCYRGTFLPYEEMSWAASPREKLRNRFLAAVSHLGRSYEERGRWEEAASCYGRGLDVDELAEELYRRLMVCHIRRGRESEALSVYRRCRRTLSSVLGVNPSPATEALSRSLGRPQV